VSIAAAMTGMRQGELLGLRWQDVDWTASKIRVRQNYVRAPMKALQGCLGHRDSRTTDRYADYAPGDKEAELVDRAFSSVHSSVQTEPTSDDVRAPEAA
jgi:site-specific recombinase XerD